MKHFWDESDCGWFIWVFFCEFYRQFECTYNKNRLRAWKYITLNYYNLWTSRSNVYIYHLQREFLLACENKSEKWSHWDNHNNATTSPFAFRFSAWKHRLVKTSNVRPTKGRVYAIWTVDKMLGFQNKETWPWKDAKLGLVHSTNLLTRSTYPNITAFHTMILFSDGAPLTPAGGSSWSLGCLFQNKQVSQIRFRKVQINETNNFPFTIHLTDPQFY